MNGKEGGEMSNKRFDIFFERHIGVGIWWDNYHYPFHLAVSLPFVSITIGFGAERNTGK